MPEALWSANSGVEFSAEEDRRLISAIWPSPGVLDGMTVTTGGAPRSVSVSAGRCVVPDLDGGGSYLCYFDSATVDLAVEPNSGSTRTDGVLVTVDDPGTGEANIEVLENNTPDPVGVPFIRIATLTLANGFSTVATGNINNSVRDTPMDPRYLPAAKIDYGPAGELPAILAEGHVFFVHD